MLPLLPLIGFLINGILGSRLPRRVVSLIACGLPAITFCLTVALFSKLLADGTPVSESLFTWVAVAGLKIDVALHFDQISAVMCMVVTGVGTLIHIYSTGYMAHDKSYARYFAYLNLFLFFMLLLVLGKNLVILFAGWEGVGIASYLLIGFWFEDTEKTSAGLKAFVVNRVGDTGFILATFLIWFFCGSMDFQEINSWFSATPSSPGIMNTIAILLLIGACGKSAQIPLHVWLPDAMAGPTPVSALIHAATMVTAGVYLLARLNGVFLQAPDAMMVVTWGGALTAFLGATMGVTQFNLKKVLAYSTMSQIGFMFMACGLGAFPVALFHLCTHAFFKACLFLGAGAVIHALHGEEDMRNMGDLAKKIPFTFGVFLIASLALCGIPPFAGFFSKDEILWSAWSAPNGSLLLWLIACFTSGLTSFYMFRAIIMTFFGFDNVPDKLKQGIHEPPPSMSIVLTILAFFSLAVGLVGLPGFLQERLGVTAPFYQLLAPVFAHDKAGVKAGEHAELMLMGIAVMTALTGILLAWIFYNRRSKLSLQSRHSAEFAYEMINKGYYFDSFNHLLVRFMDYLSESVLARRVEATLEEGVLTGSAARIQSLARFFSRLQNGNVQAYVLYLLLGLTLMLWWGVNHA